MKFLNLRHNERCDGVLPKRLQLLQPDESSQVESESLHR